MPSGVFPILVVTFYWKIKVETAKTMSTQGYRRVSEEC
jgi:hypothetical protein